jgi:hypothetical protein
MGCKDPRSNQAATVSVCTPMVAEFAGPAVERRGGSAPGRYARLHRYQDDSLAETSSCYRAPVLRRGFTCGECVITTATNGPVDGACSIDLLNGGSLFRSPVYRAPL